MKKRNWFALVITIILLCLIFNKVNFRELFETFKHFNYKYILPISLLYVITLYLRGLRWKFLLLNDSRYSSYHLSSVFTVGSMLNVFLPARAGDIYRAYYLGKTKQEKKLKLFGNIILERTFDGVCVFLLLLLGVLFYCHQAWILSLTITAGVLFIGCLILFYWIVKHNKIEVFFNVLSLLERFMPVDAGEKYVNFLKKLNDWISSFVDGFEVLVNNKCTFLSFLTSILIWGIECYITFLILQSFNLTIGLSAALFIIGLTSFSTMIPSTSMFLGPYQAAYILALGIYGIDKSTTLAISTVHQGILTIILTFIGLIYLWKFNIEIKEKKE